MNVTYYEIMENHKQKIAQEVDKYIDLYEHEEILKTLSRNLKSYFIPRIIRAILFWLIILPTWYLVQNIIISNLYAKSISSLIFRIIMII